MYATILVTLDATPADRTILDHIKPLAKQFHSQLILLHVADGWAARRFGPDAVSKEVTEDRAYLARIKAELEAEGFSVQTEMAYGTPATEIIKWVENRHCDLIAMSTHGHKFIADLILGTTAKQVQHAVNVPVLLLKARP